MLSSKIVLLYCFTVLLSFLLINHASCFLSKESAEITQPKKVPIFSPGQATKLPKKAQAKAAYGARSIKDENGDGLSVFDVYKCQQDNDQTCRDKLNELDLFYCHCYEDSVGEIVRCGYRGIKEKCKSPVFN